MTIETSLNHTCDIMAAYDASFSIGDDYPEVETLGGIESATDIA